MIKILSLVSLIMLHCCDNNYGRILSLSSKVSLFHELASLLAADGNHQTSRDLLNRVRNCNYCVAVTYYVHSHKIQLLTLLPTWLRCLRMSSKWILIPEFTGSVFSGCTHSLTCFQEGTAKYAQLASPRKSKVSYTGMVSVVTTSQ